MTKMLEATCVAGVVTADGVPVVSAEILSEGVGASSGVLFLDEDQAKYIPKTSPDLKTTLEKIASALSSIASALTTIDGKPTGTLPPAPAAAASIAQISAVQVEISALKEVLK